MRRGNKCYKFDTRDDFIAELKKNLMSKESKYILELIKNAVSYLDLYRIEKYENIIGVFKNYGFKSKNILDFTMEFKKYLIQLDKNLEKKLSWLLFRPFRKAKNSGKNIVLNRLAHEYSTQFLCFTDIFLQKSEQFSFFAELFKKSLVQKVDSIKKRADDSASAANVLLRLQNHNPTQKARLIETNNNDDSNDENDELFIDMDDPIVIQMPYL